MVAMMCAFRGIAARRTVTRTRERQDKSPARCALIASAERWFIESAALPL